jgi:hypothetical protein
MGLFQGLKKTWPWLMSWPIFAGSVVLDQVDLHLQTIQNHTEILSNMLIKHALDVEVLANGSMDNTDRQIRDKRRQDHLERQVERIAALSTEVPRMDVGYSKLFFKQPLRVAGGGMLFSPVLIPYNDTAETVGAGHWHVGVSYASSVGRKVAPQNFNASDLFVDVNDFGFTGFGDVQFLGAISGTWQRSEMYTVVGITNFIDVGARVPFVSSPEFALYDGQRFHNYTNKVEEGYSLGDIELWAKWRVFSTPGNYVRAAVRGDMRLATGSKEAANSLGIQQYSLSYILSVEPTYNLVANWTTGVTLLDGETPIFIRYVPMSSVYFTGFSGSYRVSDELAVFAQLDSHTSPYADLDDVGVDIFADPSSIFTLGTKVDSKFGLFDFGLSKGLTRSSPEYGIFFNLASKMQFND